MKGPANVPGSGGRAAQRRREGGEARNHPATLTPAHRWGKRPLTPRPPEPAYPWTSGSRVGFSARANKRSSATRS